MKKVLVICNMKYDDLMTLKHTYMYIYIYAMMDVMLVINHQTS